MLVRVQAPYVVTAAASADYDGRALLPACCGRRVALRPCLVCRHIRRSALQWMARDESTLLSHMHIVLYVHF